MTKINQKSEGSGDNVAGDKIIKYILSIPTFVWVVLILSALFFSLLEYGALDKVLRSSIVVVEGTVQFNEKPIEDFNLEVRTLTETILDTFTDHSGYFRFQILREQVNTDSLFLYYQKGQWKDSIKISSRYENETLNIAINSPPFRITYYRLKGHLPYLLLKGMIPKGLDYALGGNPKIVNNNLVAKEALYFLERFGKIENSEGETGHFIQNSVLSQYEVSYKSPVGFAAYPPYFQDYSFNSLILPDIPSLRKLLDGHEVHEQLKLGHRHSEFYLWRNLTSSDLDSYSGSYREYYRMALNKGLIWEEFDEDVSSIDFNNRNLESIRYLTKNGLPEGFMTVYGQSDIHGGYAFEALLREFELLVGVIENISASNISIQDFITATIAEKSLRTNDQTQAMFSSLKGETESDLIPMNLLTRGERLVIPLGIHFAYSEFEEEAQLYGEAQEEPSEDQPFGLPSITHGDTIMLGEKIYSDNDMDPKIYALYDSVKLVKNPNYPKRYDYGPAIKLLEVAIDGSKYPIRQFDPDNFILHSFAEAGSCPYIFTVNHNGQLVNEGHMILHAFTRENKSQDTLQVKHFSGKLFIKELEPEIAFIDQIFLKLTRPDGKVHYLFPSDERLRFVDEKEVIIHQFDQYLVLFDLEEVDYEQGKIEVILNGFYIPLNSPELFL